MLFLIMAINGEILILSKYMIPSMNGILFINDCNMNSQEKDLYATSTNIQIYLCTFSFYLESLTIDFKSESIIFVQWKNLNGEQILAKSNSHILKDNENIVISEFIDVTLEMVYDRADQKYLMKEVIIQIVGQAEKKESAIAQFSINLGQIANQVQHLEIGEIDIPRIDKGCHKDVVMKFKAKMYSRKERERSEEKTITKESHFGKSHNIHYIKEGSPNTQRMNYSELPNLGNLQKIEKSSHKKRNYTIFQQDSFDMKDSDILFRRNSYQTSEEEANCEKIGNEKDRDKEFSLEVLMREVVGKRMQEEEFWRKIQVLMEEVREKDRRIIELEYQNERNKNQFSIFQSKKTLEMREMMMEHIWNSKKLEDELKQLRKQVQDKEQQLRCFESQLHSKDKEIQQLLEIRLQSQKKIDQLTSELQTIKRKAECQNQFSDKNSSLQEVIIFKNEKNPFLEPIFHQHEKSQVASAISKPPDLSDFQEINESAGESIRKRYEHISFDDNSKRFDQIRSSMKMGKQEFKDTLNLNKHLKKENQLICNKIQQAEQKLNQINQENQINSVRIGGSQSSELERLREQNENLRKQKLKIQAEHEKLMYTFSLSNSSGVLPHFNQLNTVEISLKNKAMQDYLMSSIQESQEQGASDNKASNNSFQERENKKNSFRIGDLIEQRDQWKQKYEEAHAQIEMYQLFCQEKAQKMKEGTKMSEIALKYSQVEERLQIKQINSLDQAEENHSSDHRQSIGIKITKISNQSTLNNNQIQNEKKMLMLEKEEVQRRFDDLLQALQKKQIQVKKIKQKHEKVMKQTNFKIKQLENKLFQMEKEKDHIVNFYYKTMKCVPGFQNINMNFMESTLKMKEEKIKELKSINLKLVNFFHKKFSDQCPEEEFSSLILEILINQQLFSPLKTTKQAEERSEQESEQNSQDSKAFEDSHTAHKISMRSMIIEKDSLLKNNPSIRNHQLILLEKAEEKIHLLEISLKKLTEKMKNVSNQKAILLQKCQQMKQSESKWKEQLIEYEKLFNRYLKGFKVLKKQTRQSKDLCKLVETKLRTAQNKVKDEELHKQLEVILENITSQSDKAFTELSDRN